MILILMLLLKAILVLLIQLWVHMTALTKSDNEIKMNSVSFAGGCG